jgi:hypothetical protein
MRSEFAEWLDQMQHVADTENIIVQARHVDLLDFFFRSKKSPTQAFEEYVRFLFKWNAITDNGRNTQPIPNPTRP